MARKRHSSEAARFKKQQESPEIKPGAVLASQLTHEQETNGTKMHWAAKLSRRGKSRMKAEYGLDVLGNFRNGVYYFTYEDAICDVIPDKSERTKFLVAWQAIMGVIPFATGEKLEFMAEHGVPYTAADVANRLDEPAIRATWTEAHASFTRVMRAEKGPRTELFYGRDGFAVKDELVQMLRDTDWPLVEIERGQKFGPCDRGGWKKLQSLLKNQFDPVDVNPNPWILDAACAQVVREIIEANNGELLKPLTIEESFVQLGKNTSFSTGSGYYTFKNSGQLSQSDWEVQLQWARAIREGKVHPYLPGQVGTRSQAGRRNGENESDSYESKTRLVVADPKCMQIAAGTLMYPQLNVMQNMPQYMALAGNQVIADESLIIKPLIESDCGSSVDFERYDSTLRFLIEYWMTHYEWRLFGESERSFCEWYGENHVRAPILAEFGAYFTSIGHGLMSGKIDTNILGSKLNRVAAIYVFLEIILGEDWSEDVPEELVSDVMNAMFHMSMGDDTILFFRHLDLLVECMQTHGIELEYETLIEKLKLVNLARTYLKLGLNVSLDADKVHEFGPDTKQRIAVFLSRYYYYDAESDFILNNVASYVRVLTSLLFPENLILQERVLQATREKVKFPGVTYPDDARIPRIPLRCAWMTNSEITAPILLKYFSSLSNLWNNPEKWNRPIVKWIASNTPHGFDPTCMLKVDRILYYLEKYGSHIDFTKAIDEGLDATAFYQFIAEIHDEIKESTVDPNRPAFNYTLIELARLADKAEDVKREKAAEIREMRNSTAAEEQRKSTMERIEALRGHYDDRFVNSLIIKYEQALRK